MAASNFSAALKALLDHEGGYVNHPSDPGGATKYGITIATFRAHIKPDATVADIKAMTKDQAAKIYRAAYWDALKCDALPSGLDYAVFDYGVNSGTGRVNRVMRSLLGLSATAVWTNAVPASRAAELVGKLCDERMKFLKGLKTWPTFGKGWERRVTEVRARALTMAKAAPAAPAPVEPAAPATSWFSRLLAALFGAKA